MFKRIIVIIIILGLLFVGYRYLFPESADVFVNKVQHMFEKDSMETLSGEVLLDETPLEDFEQDVENLFNEIVDDTNEEIANETGFSFEGELISTGEVLDDDALVETVTPSVQEEATTSGGNRATPTTNATTVKTTTSTTTTTTTTISNGEITTPPTTGTDTPTNESITNPTGLSTQDMEDIKKLLDNVVE